MSLLGTSNLSDHLGSVIDRNPYFDVNDVVNVSGLSLLLASTRSLKGLM